MFKDKLSSYIVYKKIWFDLFFFIDYLDRLLPDTYNKVTDSNTLYNHASEFIFKCHDNGTVMMPPKGGFFIKINKARRRFYVTRNRCGIIYS